MAKNRKKSPLAQAHQAIDKKYLEHGGRSGHLGKPVSELNQSNAGGKGGYFSDYQNGSIYWSPATGAWEVHGDIRAKWRSLRAEFGFLGYPLTDEMPTPPPNGSGRYNHFEGGSIYWHPDTGACEIHGDIRGCWASLGWERSALGFPVTDETSTPEAPGRYNHFQGGSIYWHPELGAWEVRGEIRDRWTALGWERSYLGYPITNESSLIDPVTNRAGRISYFQNGSIQWFPGVGAIDVPQVRSHASGNMTFPGSTPVNGSANLVIRSNGSFEYSFHAHNSGAIPYNVVIFVEAVVGRIAGNINRLESGLFALYHRGTVHGADPGSRNNDASGLGHSPFVRELWPYFRNGSIHAGMSAKDSISDALADALEQIKRWFEDEDPGRNSDDVRKDVREV